MISLKFLHLSDLHLGKTVHGFSMLEDQDYILKVILAVADEEKPDGVLVCGDIYDRTVAPTDALSLFDDFLLSLVRRGILVFVISGNHDSAERLAFGSRLMQARGVYIARAYEGAVRPVVLKDTYGELDVYLLPFVRPFQIRRYHPLDTAASWTDALRAAVDAMGVDTRRRSVLLAHQFVTGATTSESEEISIGGAENVDADVFSSFDYVALGHLHRPQQAGLPTLRYCGSPLKYSFSEIDNRKSVTVAEVLGKGQTTIRTVPLVPRREMQEIRGTLRQLTDPAFARGFPPEDFFRAILTDEDEPVNALDRLRAVYPNLMRLEYDNARSRASGAAMEARDASDLSPLALFEMLYERQNGSSLSAHQKEYLSAQVEKLWREAGP